MRRSSSTPDSTSPPADPRPPDPRPAVFLDRDGTVIEDRDYLGDPAGVRLLPGAAAAIRRLNDAGLPVVVVTNQSGIGRGYFTESQYEEVRARIDQLLEPAGARILATYHCPHAPDRRPPCDCRKPATGLFRRAANELGIDLSRSVFVGDRFRDVAAAVTFRGQGYLIAADEHSAPTATGIEVVPDLGEAVERLLRSRKELGEVP